jgi:hypothetical protein
MAACATSLRRPCTQSRIQRKNQASQSRKGPKCSAHLCNVNGQLAPAIPVARWGLDKDDRSWQGDHQVLNLMAISNEVAKLGSRR